MPEDDTRKRRCKICHDRSTAEDPLFSPCKCKGSLKFIHSSCLMQWVDDDENPSCEICKHPLTFQKIFKENTPSRVPLKMFVDDIYKSVRSSAIAWFWVSVVVFLCLFIFGFNFITARTINNILFRSLFATSLVFCSFGHLALYSSTSKFIGIKKMRINTSNLLQNESSEDTESDDNNFADDTTITAITSFFIKAYKPISFMTEVFRGCALAIFIEISRIFNKIVRIYFIEKIYFSAKINFPEFIAKAKAYLYFCDLWLDFKLFFKYQNLGDFIVPAFSYTVLAVITTLVLHYLRFRWFHHRWRRLFYFGKMYIHLSNVLFWQYIVIGVSLHFFILRLNYPESIKSANLLFSRATPFGSFLFHFLIGTTWIQIFKSFFEMFSSHLRRGLFYTSSRLKFIEVEIYLAKTPFSVVFMRMWSNCFLYLLLGIIIFSGFSLYDFSTTGEIFVISISALGLLKNLPTIVKRAFKIYFFITKTLSTKFNLDNYLFNKKIVKFDTSRLFWKSNKNLDLDKAVDHANRMKKINLDLQGIIIKEEDRKNSKIKMPSLVTLPSETTEDNQTFFSINRNTIKNSNFTIDNRKFMKYFGQKHKRNLGIFFIPKYGFLFILFIKLICLILTKLMCVAASKIAHFSASMLASYVPENISYVLSLSLIVNILAVKKRTFHMIIAEFLIVYSAPAISTLIVLLFTKPLISSTTIFFTSSFFSNCFFYLLHEDFFNPSLMQIFNTIVLSALLNFIVLLLYFTVRLSFIMIFAKILFVVFLCSQLFIGFHKIFSGEWGSEIKDKYFLEKTVVVNYEENKGL